jgi:FMNH2-dependent dimethyl sulfone monooxygenase
MTLTIETHTARGLHGVGSPLIHPDSPLSRVAAQPLMIGLFLPTQTGGYSQSTLPRGTRWDFDYNKKLAISAEAHGFDFVFSLQQWNPKGGFGGEIKYRENFLDPFVTSIALSAVTERLLTIATVHVLYGNLHPLYLARFAATADHISRGRSGLNIVTGYDAAEPLMFGMHRIEHDKRYAQANEFAAIMEALWKGEDNLSYHGDFYQLEGAYVSPRPLYERPILVSACASPAGFNYAAHHSDIVFTSSPAGPIFEKAIGPLRAHVKQIHDAYAQTGRIGKVIIFPMIVCKPTRQQAYAYRDAIVEHADFDSINAYAKRHSNGDTQSWPQHVPADRVLGGHIQIVGDPDDVAHAIFDLHEAGLDGVQIGFYDYAPDLDFFAENVLPRLEKLGLRKPLA